MSELQALALILVTLVPGYFAVLYANKAIHDRADEVVSGVVKGVPASARHRAMILFNELLPTTFGLAFFTFLMTVAYAQIAQRIASESLRAFAYLCAAGAGFASAFTVILGGVFLFYLASELRQPERKSK